MHSRFPRYSLLLALATVLACMMPYPALSADKPPAKYKPLKITSKVEGTPGTVAWSPDGSRVAYIARKVEIYDIPSGRKSKLKIKNPYFLNWPDEGRLLVLHGDDNLAIVNAATMDSRDLNMPKGAVGVYSSWDENVLIVLTSWNREISIGVDVHHGLHLLDLRSDSIKDVYQTSRIIPRRYAGSEYLRGWLSAGPAPVTAEALLLEFIVPPNAPPYIKALKVDAFTGKTIETLSRHREGKLRAWGDWSPLGRKAAMVDENNRLRLLARGGQVIEVDDDVSGLYPAWDPRGGRIFLGGYLMEEDGRDRARILPKKPDSSAFFSPDGNRVAVAAGGKLWLLKGIKPSKRALNFSTDELREKSALLRELYSDGFLTAHEYRERLYAIIDRQEKGK